VQSRDLFCAFILCRRRTLLLCSLIADSRTSRYCAFEKKKKRTDERVCWVQGEAAIVTIKLCNPYAFPLFVEVVGIEACVEDSSCCDVPLEFNSSRGVELCPCLGSSGSFISIDLSVTPTVPGVISIKVYHSAACSNLSTL
jgi:hypothetical protein